MGADVKKLDVDGEIAMDHASEPWVRGLLEVSSMGLFPFRCLPLFLPCAHVCVRLRRSLTSRGGRVRT